MHALFSCFTIIFFLVLQISMSVHWIPVRVTQTLLVPIAEGLTAVIVNEDLLEMGQHVKVCSIS